MYLLFEKAGTEQATQPEVSKLGSEREMPVCTFQIRWEILGERDVNEWCFPRDRLDNCDLLWWNTALAPGTWAVLRCPRFQASACSVGPETQAILSSL